MQELEDVTPPELRGKARPMAPDAVAREHAATINRVPTLSKAEVDRAESSRRSRARAPGWIAH